MELNLLPILNFDGKKLNICESIPVSASENDSFQILEPVSVNLTASNTGGTIELMGTASAKLILVCDRCTESYETQIDFDINERLKKEDAFSDSDDDPDVITLTGTSIDLSEIIYTNLYMSLPSKNLCSDTCKGLCPECGANLNKVDCGCKTETTDPRFDILDQLL